MVSIIYETALNPERHTTSCEVVPKAIQLRLFPYAEDEKGGLNN